MFFLFISGIIPKKNGFIPVFQRNTNGTKLKDLILKQGIVNEGVEYLQIHAPPITTLLKYSFFYYLVYYDLFLVPMVRIGKN